MKKLKRVLAVLLTAIMTLAMATTAFAVRKLESYSESGKHIKRADDQSVQII